MAEVLELGQSFNAGRQRINAFFSATTEAEILASGVSLNALIVNQSISASTIYSGGTELSNILNTTGIFRENVTTGSSYTLYRSYQGDSSFIAKLYVTGAVTQFSVDFVPVIAGKKFKFEWYNQSIVSMPSGYTTENAGQIQFNNFDTSATTETFSILGNEVGEYQYLNDPASILTFNGTRIPGLDLSGITATFYPDSGSDATLESGVTRAFVVQGLIT